MEPIAYGFLIMIAGAAAMGVVVGAVGGAIAWRARWNIALGAVVTACAYLILLVVDGHGSLQWLGPQLDWGLPALTLAFLLCSLAARWLAAVASLRPTWTMLAALGLTLVLGFFYLLLLKVGPGALVPVGWWASLGLMILLVLRRRMWPAARPHP